MVLLLFQWPAGGSRTEEVSRRSSGRDEEPLTGYGPMSPTFKVPLKKVSCFQRQWDMQSAGQRLKG